MAPEGGVFGGGSGDPPPDFFFKLDAKPLLLGTFQCSEQCQNFFPSRLTNHFSTDNDNKYNYTSNNYSSF